MKRIVFNMTFVVSFLLIFSIIVKVYYADFAEALSQEPHFYPRDKSLPLQSCQGWTDVVRDFQVDDGQGADEVPVLMYHRVIDEEDLAENHFDEENRLHSTILLKESFNDQMELLREHNFTTLTSKELKLFLKGELEVPKNSIVLTFDDGSKDNYVETYPILKENGLTALNFIITGAITSKDSKYEANAYQYLSESEIINSCDVFEFQSHTYNYHKRTFNYVPYLIAKSKEDIKYDLEASIVNLDQRNRAFAYPYGGYNEETIDVLKELEFEMAYTVVPEIARPGIHLYEIPRIEIFPEDSLEDFKRKIRLN
ncbi:polysaccharide deacetylase family protein [Evansella sp. AB-P1]|uniref:polysaccharide deacetylase family protein n=1 Tax=Evansella sp. AB-P1 TaxID=3037653 RepID=UPI00241C3EB8|nr:polysaccharide deacetylase family protein [Evansella sp. AB-P1]MDG5786357.1 polysaccharide deacetylase family protein [Evansella sp. AB-P1]